MVILLRFYSGTLLTNKLIHFILLQIIQTKIFNSNQSTIKGYFDIFQDYYATHWNCILTPDLNFFWKELRMSKRISINEHWALMTIFLIQDSLRHFCHFWTKFLRRIFDSVQRLVNLKTLFLQSIGGCCWSGSPFWSLNINYLPELDHNYN